MPESELIMIDKTGVHKVSPEPVLIGKFRQSRGTEGYNRLVAGYLKAADAVIYRVFGGAKPVVHAVIRRGGYLENIYSTVIFPPISITSYERLIPKIEEMAGRRNLRILV